MKGILEFFTRKWVIQLLGIIALSLLIWFLGDLIGLHSEIARLLTILVIVVLWGFYNLYRQIQINRATTQMVEGLTSSESNDTTAQLNEEVGILSGKLTEALHLLKKTQGKKRQDSQYLYDLPWYMLIGSPGSGKTTALLNSGLNFPLTDTLGKGGVRGVGGTRNCDWWFTDHAVIIDTAGRYTTQDSHEAVDKAVWLNFLGLLKKYRPRRPINGVLITMSLPDLLQSEEERHRQAHAVRQRIDELHEQFGIRLPIYMIFTKGDLIAGFNDFFADLSKTEINQVWGVTFPKENPNNPSDVLARFLTDFDDLLAGLQTRLLKRLQEERDLQRRALIFGFPQRIALLKENLQKFLQECYSTNRYQAAPYLRGVYFTSATQEGTPIDRLMGMLAQTFQVGKVNVPLLSGKGKSYFITRLLKEVIFEEALLVGVNPRLERLQTLLRRGVYSAAGLIILLMGFLWGSSYYKNQAALAEVNLRLQRYDNTAKENINWQSDFALLLERLNALQNATQVYSPRPPLLMTFGLYQGDKLQPHLQETYHDLLRKQFLPLILSRLELHIREQFNQQYDKNNVLYQLLEAYLMLRETDKLNPDLVRLMVAFDWQKTYADDVETQKGLMVHLDNLLKLPPSLLSSRLDESLIANARHFLKRIPISQQIYMRINSDASQNPHPDFKLLAALGMNAERVFATKKNSLAQQTLPYLFTYDGFYALFLTQVKQQLKQLSKQDWVRGEAIKTGDNSDAVALKKEIYQLYYKDYIQHWDALIANLTLKHTSNAKETTDILEVLSRSDSPLRKFLEVINKETSLSKKPVGELDKIKTTSAAALLDSRASKALEASVALQDNEPLGVDVEEHFQPLTAQVKTTNGGAMPLDNTLANLKQLYDCMIRVSSTSNMGAAAMAEAQERTCPGVASKIEKEAKYALPEPLKSMTQTLAAESKGVIFNSSKEQLNRLWQSEVIAFYKQAIQGRYPFSKASSNDMTLDDFSRLFAQGGLLDQFFNTHLKPFVDTSGKTWRMISQDGQTIAVSPVSLAQFQAAQKLRTIFFAAGSQKPLLNFTLKPLMLRNNPKKFWLDIEGQKTEYTQNELPRPVAFQWPGASGNHLVSFGFETADGRPLQNDTQGDWAWFKVLEKANIQQVEPNSVKFFITFDIEGVQADYELTASSVNNPFSLKEFDTLHLPASL